MSAKSPSLLILAVVMFALSSMAAAQPVVINEFMAANDSTIIDPVFGEYADWIELYNPGPSAVELDGYFLTDDLAVPRKWLISGGVTIQPYGYVVFWADGRDMQFHPSFRLSAHGESVGLYAADGRVVDHISFGVQSRDISYGRSPDGADALRYFAHPTPGRPNTSEGFLGIAERPVFSTPAGFYPAALSVTLTTGLADAEIRYTTDGSPPESVSTLYDAPIFVPSTTVIRAAVFKPGYVPSEVTTRTYLIGETASLPVVSLSTDPANFFDDEIGIYVEGTNGIPGYCRDIPLNWNQDWERPIHVEFFEPDGTMGFSIDAGVKLHGGCTRIYPQKSLAIFARRKYGASRIDYPVFGPGGLPSYNNLVLRSSAQDWWRTMFRDGMIQTLIARGMDVETQAYRPAVVFLNGEYWGIHNLREKQNEHYLADHFGVDPDAVEILDGSKADLIGQSAHYDAMMSFMLSADMSRAETLETIRTWMDVDNYIDYLIAEIYAANSDWPGNNLKFWRPTTSDGRWRWMIFDMDFGFGGNANGQYTSNTLALATDPNGADWPNPPWSTLLFRTLLESPAFRDEFIQRFAVHVNTTFDVGRVLQTIDSLKARIADEIPRHKARWPKSISYGSTWEELVEIMRVFARKRPLHVRPHFYDHFGLSGSSRLTLHVDEHDGGYINVHGVKVPGPTFSDGFFRDVPIKLQAMPNSGYRFDGWTGDVQAISDTASIVLTGDATLTALFSRGTGTPIEDEAPLADRLYAAYPNPFSLATRVEFDVSQAGPVTIRLHDILGRNVSTVIDARLSAGRHSRVLDGSRLPSGTYFLTLRSATTVQTTRVVLLR